ncbi:ferredoxin [Rhodococcus sp. NPDC003318]|uniref:ferredoxin n=1 Tax=Rhodococcus sp. NPDC003318 TaxID=3364503 RepID=UPI00368F27DA
MKIQFDEAVCQGHGRCYEIAPDVFSDDDRGHAELRVAEVTGDLVTPAQEAAWACPERAITVTE